MAPKPTIRSKIPARPHSAQHSTKGKDAMSKAKADGDPETRAKLEARLEQLSYRVQNYLHLLNKDAEINNIDPKLIDAAKAMTQALRGTSFNMCLKRRSSLDRHRSFSLRSYVREQLSLLVMRERHREEAYRQLIGAERRLLRTIRRFARTSRQRVKETGEDDYLQISTAAVILSTAIERQHSANEPKQSHQSSTLDNMRAKRHISTGRIQKARIEGTIYFSHGARRDLKGGSPFRKFQIGGHSSRHRSPSAKPSLDHPSFDKQPVSDDTLALTEALDALELERRRLIKAYQTQKSGKCAKSAGERPASYPQLPVMSLERAPRISAESLSSIGEGSGRNIALDGTQSESSMVVHNGRLGDICKANGEDDDRDTEPIHLTYSELPDAPRNLVEEAL